MHINLRHAGTYIQHFLKIRTKAGKLETLRFNPPQQKLYEAIRAQHREGRPIRIIILKARQMGFSTLTAAVIFQRTAVREPGKEHRHGPSERRDGQPVWHVQALL